MHTFNRIHYLSVISTPHFQPPPTLSPPHTHAHTHTHLVGCWGQRFSINLRSIFEKSAIALLCVGVCVCVWVYGWVRGSQGSCNVRCSCICNVCCSCRCYGPARRRRRDWQMFIQFRSSVTSHLFSSEQTFENVLRSEADICERL